MEKYLNMILRHSSWIIIAVISMLLLYPTIAEFKTFLLIFTCECFAIALSGLALYAYTQIDFTRDLIFGEKDGKYQVIGSVFLGVHILIGLVVLGVYIAQFSN
jgi:hypothetical protein